MTGAGAPLDRVAIQQLLAELGEDLAAEGVLGHVFIVGGAAMALGYNTRRTTADVDGVFEPKSVIYEAARRVAERHPGLPHDWLNDSVKGLLPASDPGPTVVLDLPGITVSIPSARYMLALKVQAARVDRDQDDIRFLANEVGATTASEVLTIAEEVIGRSRLTPKAQFIVEEMFPDEQPGS